MKAKTNELKKQLASCPVDETEEVVLFEVRYEDEDLMTEYATWFKGSKGSLCWGNYFPNKRAAIRDFANRILDELKGDK